MKKMEVDANCGLDDIRHSGIIKKIDKEIYYVSIVAQSACDSCHAKGTCNVSSLVEEVIEVPGAGQGIHQVGDRVQVYMKKSLGTRAVMLGYLIPFVLVLVTLIIVLIVTDNEGLAGLLSLGVLVPYYLLLQLIRKRLKKTFTFSIR